ncbi:MAG: hypothetical protein LQ342_007334 [Letrouitia transgressa]|nr:MAG: hypothetical protein LQ342_007334 [Letrouitia transgressa]
MSSSTPAHPTDPSDFKTSTTVTASGASSDHVALSTSTSASSKSPSPRRLLTDAISQSSIPLLTRALTLFPSLLPSALSSSVSAGSIPLNSHLLKTYPHSSPEGSVPSLQLSNLSPIFVAQCPSIPLLELLVQEGWDINTRAKSAQGARFIELVAHDEEMVKWALDHGAEVDGPVLTEKLAAVGSVASFQRVMARGGVLGRRVLHLAVKSAGTCEEPERAQRIAMLEFLVNEVGCNINASDGPPGEQLPERFGTPLAYAKRSKGEGSDQAVQWLIKKGAKVGDGEWESGH